MRNGLVDALIFSAPKPMVVLLIFVHETLL